MKQAAIFLIFLIGKVAGMETTELKGAVSRVEGDFGIRIEYETEYEAKLGVSKGHLLQQRIARFYDGDKHVGSYYYWQEVGSGLPAATTSRDLLVKPPRFTEVRVTDRFYDVNWHDGRLTEQELGTWFKQTWYLFNSCNPKGMLSGYYLCDIEDIPRMDGYLKGSGFTLYAVLEHSFSLPNTNQAEQGGTGQPATRLQLKSEGSHKPQQEAEGRSR